MSTTNQSFPSPAAGFQPKIKEESSVDSSLFTTPSSLDNGEVNNTPVPGINSVKVKQEDPDDEYVRSHGEMGEVSADYQPPHHDDVKETMIFLGAFRAYRELIMTTMGCTHHEYFILKSLGCFNFCKLYKVSFMTVKNWISTLPCKNLDDPRQRKFMAKIYCMSFALHLKFPHYSDFTQSNQEAEILCQSFDWEDSGVAFINNSSVVLAMINEYIGVPRKLKKYVHVEASKAGYIAHCTRSKTDKSGPFTRTWSKLNLPGTVFQIKKIIKYNQVV